MISLDKIGVIMIWFTVAIWFHACSHIVSATFMVSIPSSSF